MIEQYLDCLNQDVLEVGCGDGNLSVLLAPKARKYIAIDPDSNRLKKATTAYPEGDFRIGNGESLAFDDGTFSRVLFTLSLHHQNPYTALQETHRVLTEGGCVVVVKPSADGEFQQFFHLFDDETKALKQALSVIRESHFDIERNELFWVDVSFNNHEELCGYPFDRLIQKTDDILRILNIGQTDCVSIISVSDPLMSEIEFYT